MIIKILRRSIQAVFLIAALLIPVFDILRFDISTMELYLFRQVWSFSPEGEFMSGAGGNPIDFIFKGIVPWIVIFITLPVWGIIFGRFLCGWFCPGGAILEIGDYAKKQVKSLKEIWSGKKNPGDHQETDKLFKPIISLFIMLTALLISCFFFTGYFISPTKVWSEVITLSPSTLLVYFYLGILVTIIVTYVFAGHLFCSYICLAGLTQMLPSVASPFSLRIKFRQTKDAKCTNCKGCDEVCFMEIRPRSQGRKVSPKCVNCGECIVACEKELGKNKVLSYGFGPDKGSIKKQAVPKQDSV